MPKITFTVESDLPPERILAAAKDFTERRPDVWPNVSRKYYEIHEVTDNFAEVTEGTEEMGGMWARERYEWPEPNVVRATIIDGNIFKPGGTWTMRVTPKNGGSHVEVVNHRQLKGVKGRLMGAVMQVIGRGVLTRAFNRTLDILKSQPAP